MTTAAAAAGSISNRRGSPGTLPPPPEYPEIKLVYSTTGYQSPAPVHEADVSGDIVVWLDNNQSIIETTMWFLNTTASIAELQAAVLLDVNPSIPGFVRGDQTIPFNLKGGQGTPIVLDTTTLIDGLNEVKVAVRFRDRATVVVVGVMNVDNNLTPVQYPQIPTGLTSSSPADGTGRWTWTSTPTGVGGFDNTVGYKFRYHEVDPPTEGGSTGLVTSPIDVTNLEPGVRYYGQIRGVDADGDESDWSASVPVDIAGGTGGMFGLLLATKLLTGDVAQSVWTLNATPQNTATRILALKKRSA